MPLLCAGDQSRDDHAFDHQVGDCFHDEAVLDGARFALVGIADDVLGVAWGVANDLPLDAGGKARTSHAAQAAGFQGGDGAAPVACLYKASHQGVTRGARVWVGDYGHLRTIAGFGRKRTAGCCIARDGDGLACVQSAINPIIDCESGGFVAATEARDVANGNVVGAAASEGLFQLRFKFRATAEVASHVGANLHFRAWRRGQMEMRIEAGDRMNLAYRDVDPGS